MDKQSELLRQNAENCLALSEKATNEPSMRRYLRMAEAWKALADEQDWLDGEVSPLDRQNSKA
jgi:hypothetical protein